MKKNENNIVFEECIECNDRLWIFIHKYNALCTLDMEKGEITYVASIPDEKFCKERLVTKIVSYNNDLILLPMSAKNINIYHIKTNTWDEVKIPDTTCKYEPNYKFMDAVIEGRYLYAIGSSFPGIVQFDLVTYKILKITECYVGFTKKEMKHIWVRTNCVKIGNELYLASCVSNEVMRLCLDDLSYKILKIGGEKNRYSGMALDDQGFFWLSPLFNTSIVKWDGEKSYKEISINNQSDEGFFSGIIICDKIKIFPRMLDGYTIIIDEKNNITKINTLYHIYKKINKNKSIYQDFHGNCCIIEKGKVIKRIFGICFDGNLKISELEKNKILLDDVFCHEDGCVFSLKNYIDSVINLKELLKIDRCIQTKTSGSVIRSFLSRY